MNRASHPTHFSCRIGPGAFPAKLHVGHLRRVCRGFFVLPFLLSLLSLGLAQVDYEDDRPWEMTIEDGPDAEVPGWFINLGITGVRVVLDPAAPKTLLVRYVFADTPAAGRIQVNDRITGAAGALFLEDHQTGYGPDVFGARGPVSEFATALDRAQGADGDGNLNVTIQRAGANMDVVLPVGQAYGGFSATYPENCPKSAKILRELLDWLLLQQKPDGSWGEPIEDLFAPLALMAVGGSNEMAAVRRNVEYHASTTQTTDDRWLVNWYYTTAGIVLAEYFHATGEDWVIPELQEVYDFLLTSQYTDLSQVHPDTETESLPTRPGQAIGGWGHNPGYEGYGPHGMLTGQGALAWGLMRRCGIAVDASRHAASYAFMDRGTGRNHYFWYSDDVAEEDEWADMGRTGAAAMAYQLSGNTNHFYRSRALSYATLIGNHPQSFPDTHASPQLGMGFTGMAAFIDAPSFRKLMDANKWWFTTAHTHDGMIYYQPNRDNSRYDYDSRLASSAVTAFLFTLPKRNLVLSGKYPVDYDIWAGSFPGTNMLNGRADADGDGVSNHAEWIWNTPPADITTAPDETTLSAKPIFLTPEKGRFVYQRRDPAVSRHTFEIWVSTDLQTWQRDPAATQTASPMADPGTQKVDVFLGEDFRDLPEIFARVQATPAAL